VMIVVPSARPVMVNAPIVVPAAIGTLGGSRSTTPPGAESMIATPPVGAGTLKVMTPAIVRLRSTAAVGGHKEIPSTATLTVAV